MSGMGKPSDQQAWTYNKPGDTWVGKTVGSGGGTASRGTFASRPAPGTAGALYFCTDAPFVYFDDGAAWNQHGPIFNLMPTPGQTGSWSGPNFNIISNRDAFTQVGDSVFASVGANDTQLHGFIKGTISNTASFTVTMAFVPGGGNFGEAGILLWASGSNASTTKFLDALPFSNNGAPAYGMNWWNASFNRISDVFTNSGEAFAGAVVWLRLRKPTGGNYFMETSVDGQNWTLQESTTEASTGFVNPTHYGINLFTAAATTASMVLMSLNQT